MIEGRTIVCFASGYNAPPTSKHHVMHLLAERNRVLWINYHASRAPTACAADLCTIGRKLREVLAGLRRPRQNFYVLTPLLMPLPASAAARKANAWLLVVQIRRALRKVGLGPVHVWSFTPDISYLLGRFSEEKVLYYCVDEHASFTGYDRAQVLRDEEELCRRADLVVTTSQVLQEGKRRWNPKTILVPHGVDYEHFSRALCDHLPEPSDMAGIPHPRLGFAGLIRDWIDLDLLAEVAARRPDWHLVMIGDSTIDLRPYRAAGNLHFLGRKPYEDLPAYFRHCDVALVPFKINDLTRAVNPIKLREYLAAGLPVVSTPLPEAARYGQFVEIAASAEDFAAAIARVLLRRGDAHRRAATMAGETWRQKVECICQHFAAVPPRGRGGRR